jgi:predicted transcriptional regulator of viral defense system
MTQVEALAKLGDLGQPFFETRDLAALLDVKRSNATQIATRLARTGLLVKLARGKWALKGRANRLAIAEHLTSPFPAYISLQSALYHHGMISQIPSVTYAVSIGRPRRYETSLGAFSIHHVEPHFFFGYETDQTGSAKIAVPEKAVVDVFYFRPTRTRLFVDLPEVEFPKTFDWTLAGRMAREIRSRSRRALVERALASTLNSTKHKRRRRTARLRLS